MPSKKFQYLSELSDNALADELKETTLQYQHLRFDHATNGLEDPLSLRKVKKDIARLKTEVRRRELEGMSKEQLQKRSKIRARRRKK